MRFAICLTGLFFILIACKKQVPDTSSEAVSDAYFSKDCPSQGGKSDLAYSIFIPNSFTPDGDGLNDAFGPVILGGHSQGYQLRIFDPANNEIYESTDLSLGWSGMLRNTSTPAPMGTYKYSITVMETCRGIAHYYTGSVMLIRND